MKLFWTVLGLSGCAPAYHPAALHPTLFDEGNELSVAGHASLSGLQLSGAYAPIHRLAIRGRAQWWVPGESDDPTTERYWLAALGVEGFDAPNDTMRVAVGLEAGVGRVDAETVVVILNSPTTYNAHGALLQFAIPFTLGWEFGQRELVGTGFTGRVVTHTIFNDLTWSGRTRGTLVIGEAAAFFRVGKGVKFDTQLGLSIPFRAIGDTPEAYFPLMFGVGIMGDFDLKKREEPGRVEPVAPVPEVEPVPETSDGELD